MAAPGRLDLLVAGHGVVAEDGLAVEHRTEQPRALLRQRARGEEERGHARQDLLHELRHRADRQEVVQQRQVPELDQAHEEVRAVKHIRVCQYSSQNIKKLIKIWVRFF